MTDIKSQTSALWSECSRIITQRFGLQAPPVPKSVKVIDGHDISRIGGHYSSTKDELQLHPEVVSEVIPLRGVIFRECFFHSMPPELCFEASRDMAFEFARQMLKKEERTSWIIEWQKIPTERVRVNLLYTSYKMMEWIIALGGQSELDSLVHEFASMARYGISLDFNEYVDYLTLRAQNIVVELGNADLKIIDVLLKNETASYRQVAKTTGLSESWVCTRINRLKRKYILRSVTTTPFSRIGIRTFHVMLAGPSRSEPSRILEGCPFVYDVRSVLNGPWQTIARLAIPDCTGNIQSLDQMSSMLNNNGIAVDIAETYSVGISNSFYHYNTEKRRWEIPWIAMRGWGHKITEESLHHVVERIDLPAKTTDAYLDSIDMEILALVNNRITSSRALRKRLAIGQAKLSSRIKKLRSEDLIRRVWNVQNLGLVERVAIRANDRDTASILDTWARELPHAFLRYEENRKLLMMTDLPAGGSTQLMDTLRSLKWAVIVSPLSSGIWGQWQFPFSLWDVESQCWQSPKDEIATWLGRVGEECENLAVEAPHSSRAISRVRQQY
ncbi:MAG: winged helix-turn-helix transcriptional regulator [Candidatus Thorarchaeota archaeon]|nr:winged helix-turn-helix transcriptional regulator [Candidatus Thorarchaeota archaeon]